MSEGVFHMEVEGLNVRVERRGLKGTYQVRFGFGGRDFQKTLRTSNKREAMRRVPAKVREILASHCATDSDSKPLSFELGLIHYEQRMVADNKAKSVSQARCRVSAFIKFLVSVGVESFAEIRSEHAYAFLDHVKGDGERSDSTAHGYLRFAKAFLKHLLRHGLIENDPFANVAARKPKFRRSTLLELGDVNLILEQVPPDYLPAIAAAAFLGCRRETITRIRREDVDFEAGLIYIRKPDHSSKVVSRFVPIHPRLRKILEAYNRPDSEWFFCTQPSQRYRRGGNKLKGDRLNDEFKRAAAAAGYPVGRYAEHGLTFHCLRGFFKSHAIHAQVPREVVDHWQGHQSDRSVGTRHYFNLSNTKSIEWMDSIEF